MSRSATLNKLRNCVPVIAPSMLKCDFGNLHRELELLDAAGTDVYHLDVMDGNFVPNLSYGPMVIERLRPRTDAIFDAHLMISDPDRFLDEYIKAGCDCVTFHVEAVPDAGPLLERIRQSDIVAGLAINPGTPVEQIEEFLPACDLVLVMSVEPGFGGQKFIPSALDKLRRLREITSPETILSIDGGVAASTIGDCAAAGADLFVAGSSIFDMPDYGSAMNELSGLAISAVSSSS
ncbi:MAG: ribulose-phosphate 3-epimerase [Planctomycetota bacterium]|nr:ribulose-phosphate 3-epimerase [Planctomycetota bacterium]MDA1250054.1 ribulose-phosphate 3-epimerase [Planctomycetota bacterium]